MVNLSCMSPVAQIVRKGKVEPASRCEELTGKTIGFFWNLKENGDVVIEETKRLLSEKYGEVYFKQLRGFGGMIVRSIDDKEAASIAKECDAVVASIGS